MSFDLIGLKDAVAQHGRVVRVVIAAIKGSSPREVGAAMLIWPAGQSGTIGGGALEFDAAKSARALAGDRMSTHALGPELGQCCGGSVTLLSEVYDADRIAGLDDRVIARTPGGSTPPLAVSRMLATARNGAAQIGPQLVQGWFVEPVSQPQRHLWIWGAGHVGRALVGVIAPLPDVAITWVDTQIDRFPADVPQGVEMIPAAAPAALVPRAPAGAEHVILTYSHALDLELCHQLLRHGFGSAGLIGSKTKWARFRKRLSELGHAPDQITRIQCPIGAPSLGKHPQAIAIGVAQEFIERGHNISAEKAKRA